MAESLASVQDRKRGLRVDRRKQRAALDDQERYDASLRIAAYLLCSPVFIRSRSIACYLSTREEVDTWPIIERAWRRKKRIFAPLTRRGHPLSFCEVTPSSDLVGNEWGLMEPVAGAIVDARRLDLVLTPLVAFDRDRHRIGMGGGYYDRTFAFLGGRRHLFRPKLVGLAFACQQVEKIAVNPWDISLNGVLTENGWV